MRMKNSFFALLAFLVLSLAAVSCGGDKPVLTGIKVETVQQDMDTWMNFSADLNLEAMSFGTVTVPIFHPRTQLPIGQLELTSLLSNKSHVKISINLSKVTDLETGEVRLPNGSLVPIIANNPAISIDVGNGGKVYLILTKDVVAIGTAIPISAFDEIGENLPGINIFPVMQTDDIIGTVGIFTGLNPGQNGIAVVADVSNVVKLGEVLPDLESSGNMKLDYRSRTVSRSKKKALMEMLRELNREKTILRMR